MRMEGLGHHLDKGRSNMHKLMSKDNESLEMRTKPVKKRDQRALWEQAASHQHSTSQWRTKVSSGRRGRWSYREQGPPSHPRGGR